MGNILDDIKSLVVLKGDEIKNGEPECAEWHLTHKNCASCRFELGCSKQVAIGLTIMASNEFNSDKIQQTVDEILDTKTIKALKSIRIPEIY